MATGFTRNGVDLDDIFDPYVQGSKPGLTGHAIGGADLRDRYAPLSYGTQAAATGLTVAGVGDLNVLFAAKGSAVYTIPGLHGNSFDARDGALTNQPSVSASVSWSINSNGTWGASGGTSRGPTNWSPVSGTWLPAGESAANWEVQFVVSTSGGANLVNNAPTYQNCGTSRGGSLALPSAGGTSFERNADASVIVNLRRVGGSATASSFSISLMTVGYQ